MAYFRVLRLPSGRFGKIKRYYWKSRTEASSSFRTWCWVVLASVFVWITKIPCSGRAKIRAKGLSYFSCGWNADKRHENACLQKLERTKGSEVDTEVNNRFGSSSSTGTFDPAIECARSEHARSKNWYPKFKSLTYILDRAINVDHWDLRHMKTIFQEA